MASGRLDMILTIPDIGEGELVYSFIARCKSMMGITDRQARSVLLGGANSSIFSADLTLHLEILSSRLASPRLSGSYLLDNHTMFPYWAHFLAEEGYASARRLMLEGWNGSGSRVVSRGRDTGEARYLRFCHVCIEEDLARLGAPAWRRDHQMPAVSICHAHGEDLWDSEVPCGVNQVLHPCPGDPLRASLAPHVLGRNAAVRLSAASAWLIRHPTDRERRFSMPDRVRTAIGKAGWMDRGDRPGRNIDGRALMAAIKNHFGSAGLERLGAGLGSAQWVTWLHTPVPGRRVTPLMYLLLADFLRISPECLLTTVPDSRWPGRIAFPRANEGTQPIMQAPLEVFRERIRLAMEACPAASRSDLSRAEPYAYASIRKFDSAWCEANLPNSIGEFVHKSWPVKDRKIARRLLDVVEAILSMRPLERITRGKCSEGLGYRLTDKRLRHLPETLAALNQTVETAEAFRLRKPAMPGSERQPLRNGPTG